MSEPMTFAIDISHLPVSDWTHTRRPKSDRHIPFAASKPKPLSWTPMQTLGNPQIRKLKGLGQRLEPMLKMGKAGLSEGFVKSVDEALALHELIKVKFDDLKEQKQELAVQLATGTQSHLVMRVGHVVVLYRQNPDSAKQKIKF